MEFFHTCTGNRISSIWGNTTLWEDKALISTVMYVIYLKEHVILGRKVMIKFDRYNIPYLPFPPKQLLCIPLMLLSVDKIGFKTKTNTQGLCIGVRPDFKHIL